MPRGFRICSKCNQRFFQGFLIHDGLEYYCSEPCLHKVYTPEDYEEMYENDCAYWTEWEDEDDPDFIPAVPPKEEFVGGVVVVTPND